MGRPHYHAILFNCSFDDLEIIGRSGDHDIMKSNVLGDIWGKGLCQVGTVTADSAGYVARYCLKKVTGINADEHYKSIDGITGEVTNVHPEYSTMSRGGSSKDGINLGGIGKVWFDKFHGDLFPSNETPIPGKSVIKGVPRYYDNLMLERDEDLLLRVKDERMHFRAVHADEYSPFRLMDKYKVKKAQIKSLTREL